MIDEIDDQLLGADDIFLFSTIREQLKYKLECQRKVLGDRGFKISWNKSEFIPCRNRN